MSNDLFNNEAEQYLLAAIIRYPEAYWDINEIGLSASDFIGSENRKVASAILAVVKDKKEPVLPLVIEALKEHEHDSTVDYVAAMSTVPVSAEQAKEYAKVVKSLSVSRAIGMFGAKAIAISQEKRSDYVGALAEVETSLRRLSASAPDQSASAKVGDILSRFETRKPTETIPITFSPTLQAMTGGYRREHFWVIGGFSSTGKSAFAVNIVLDAIEKGKRVAVVSAEMNQETYLVRLLAAMTGISQTDIQSNVTIGLQRQQSLQLAKERLQEAHLYMYDDLYTMPKIRTEMTRLSNKEGLDLFVLDYIQNVTITGDEVADAREVALECQRIAKDLGCTVVAMSQLSNAQARFEMVEKGGDDYYSLKGHGAIRDAADVVLTLHRDRKNMSSALKVKFRKNRHGPISDFMCEFNLATGRIEEIEWEAEEDGA